MKKIISQMPDHCKAGWDLGQSASLDFAGPFHSLLILGMGGSAIGGDIAVSLMRERAKIPAAVNRTYELPTWVDKRTLLIACSYSGNTEEVLSALARAKDIACPCLGISSGGQLQEEFSEGKNFIQLPRGLPPRATIGYALWAQLAVLDRLQIAQVPPEERQDCLQVLATIKEENSKALTQAPAYALAKLALGKIPLIYATAGIGMVAALRWKSQFNENSKILAFAHEYPELSHNEIVGWQDKANILPFVEVFHLLDKQADNRILKRMAICKEMLLGQGVRVHNIHSRGKYPLSRAMSLVMLGDYTSCFLAYLYGIDPFPVDIIEVLKKKLANP